MKNWLKQNGYLTPGGDPSYICPVCKSEKSIHVYGIENPNRKDKCLVCNTPLKYPWEKENGSN